MTLADDIRACVRCPLTEKQEDNAKHVPGGAGSLYQPGGVAIIADAPGYYDAKAGVALTTEGRNTPGKMLDELLAIAGMSRDELFVTYSVRCRPPNNRLQDYPEAVITCGGWTEEEMRAYDPAVVVLMGRVALRSVFGADASVMNTRGWHTATKPDHPWGHKVMIATYGPGAASFAGGVDSEPAQFIIKDLKAAKATAEALRRGTIEQG